MAVPGLASALALILAYGQWHGFRQSFAFILVGHVVFTLPFMVRAVSAAFARDDLQSLVRDVAADAVDAAFARAAHVARHRVCVTRVACNAMETRGCIAEYDAYEDRYTLRATVQSVHGMRQAIAGWLERIA